MAGLPSQPLMTLARSQAMIAPTFAHRTVSLRLTRFERVSKWRGLALARSRASLWERS